MTPLPPSPADGSYLPPQRPSAKNLDGDTAERDLWELDELMAEDQEPARRAQIEPIRRDQGYDQQRPQPAPATIPPKPIQAVPVLTNRSNVTRRVTAASRAKPSPEAEQDNPIPASAPGRMRVEPTFDELSHWDEADAGGAPAAAIEDVFEELPETQSRQLRAAAMPAESALPEGPREPLPKAEPPAPLPAPAPPTDEFGAKPLRADARISLVPKLKLKAYEKIGIVAFAILLIGGGVWTYLGTISRIAAGGPDPLSALPAQGSQVTITKVETYWREPVTTGDGREIVRRGVVLIPVAEITASGKGAVRVIFSDDRGVDVGDPTIREVNGETALVIPATAGFEDTGSHSAYQAGMTKDWHVNIAEAATTTAAGSDFKPLSKIAIKPTLQ
jgi:hypothetical protein